MRKKLITMGLVSALGASTSVMAADLDGATAAARAPQTYATDSAAAANADGTITLVGGSPVNNTAFGFGVAGGNQTYVRFDITGAEFEGAVTTGNLAITLTANAAPAGVNTSVAQGGADEGTFVIFDVTSNTSAPIAQTSNVAFTPAVSSSGSGSPSVTMAVYDTPGDATNQQNALYSISGVWAAFQEGLSVENTTSTETAEVTTAFTLFESGATTSNTGTLGNFAMTLDTGALAVGTGAALTNNAGATGLPLITDAPNAALTLNGDVSFGDWFIDEVADNCAAATVDLVEDTDTFDNATANAGALAPGVNYNLCVLVDGTESINAGDYEMEFAWDTGTRPLPTADATVAIGSIVRNGTTVNIPYLTTFEDYNQRLVIVNRGATDANYSVTFTTEDGTTATAGTAATGTVPAGEVLSIKASDIVTLAGRTRTAATLVVVAPGANIDVATNQVNLSDGSTDTVVYQ